MLALLAILFSICAGAVDLQGQIAHKNGVEITVAPGQAFPGVLRIWPYTSGEIERFRELEGQKITPYFFLHRIDELRRSPNNEDVIEIFGNFIMVTDFGITSFLLWEYGETKIPITMLNIRVEAFKVEGKKLHVLEQPFDSQMYLSSTSVSILSLLLLSLSIGGVIYRKKYLATKKKLHYQWATAEAWRNKVLEVNERSEYEEMFYYKDDWKHVLEIDEASFQNFCKLVEENQYKKEWDQMILEEIQGTFRSVFKELQF